MSEKTPILVVGDESDIETQQSCGNIKKDLILKDREYQCDSYGVKIDRDYNASLNILSERLRILNKNCRDDKDSLLNIQMKLVCSS